MKIQHQSTSVWTIIKSAIVCIGLFLNQNLSAFNHPGGMHPKAQIDFVKHQIKLKNAPYYTAFNDLIKATDSAFIKEHHAIADFSVPGYYVKPAEHRRNSLGFQTDAFNAYACALAWQLTGEKRYANRALYFMNAWGSINKKYSESDGPLVTSYSGTAMIIAAELMRDYKGWKKDDKQLFAQWIINVYQKASNEIRYRKNNWADWGRLGSTLSAYYLDDEKEMAENIRLVKSDLFDKIADDGHMPEETRRGANGIWYTYFSLAPITATSWVIYNTTGENIFAMQKDKRSIKAALDYLLYYNQHPKEWKWFENPAQGVPGTSFPVSAFWPANLIEAMTGIYNDPEYLKYVAPHRPLNYTKHHFAWTFPTLMPLSLHGYQNR